MNTEALTVLEFSKIRDFFQQESGIRLAESKKSLVCGRLNSRLRALKIPSYQAYLSYISEPQHSIERQLAIDLLTTNETYFYREPKHFIFLTEYLQNWTSERTPVIWSAACSSGEEPYTLAMLMAERFGTRPWQILASDLSQRMLTTARTGLYPVGRTRELPEYLLKKYCLRGKGQYDGYILIDDFLQHRVSFMQRNLMEPQQLSEKVDIVFLRNVLIYFDNQTKKQIIKLVSQWLKPDGLLFTGHSESLHGISEHFYALKPALYQYRGG